MNGLKDIFSNMGVDDAWLYHGSPRAIEPKVLHPRPNTTIAGEEGHFVFATSHLLSSIVYAMKTDDMVTCGVMNENGIEYTACIIADRKKFLSQSVNGTVYKLPKGSFRNVSYNSMPSSEWISTIPIELSEENTVYVPDIETVMAMGGQIFFLKDGMTKEEFFLSIANKPITFQSLTNDPMYIWENRERGLIQKPQQNYGKLLQTELSI